MKKLSVIIVNYNTRDILKDCIKNLEGSYTDMELIIVDNASSDGSAEMVKSDFPKEEYPWIELIETENKGLAVANNIGLKKATGEYLLYLGSDAFPKKEDLPKMIEWMDQNPETGMATAELVMRDGKIDMDAHRGFPTPWASLTHFSFLNKLFPKSKLFNQYFMGWEDMTVVHEIDLCISHFMIVRKSLFDDIGLWDEDFFLYGEDVDLCWRTKKAGWKIMYLPMWKVTHYKGVATGLRKATSDITKASKETKVKISATTTSAMKLFYNKNMRSEYPFWLTGLIIFAITGMQTLRVLKAKIFG